MFILTPHPILHARGLERRKPLNARLRRRSARFRHWHWALGVSVFAWLRRSWPSVAEASTNHFSSNRRASAPRRNALIAIPPGTSPRMIFQSEQIRSVPAPPRDMHSFCSTEHGLVGIDGTHARIGSAVKHNHRHVALILSAEAGTHCFKRKLPLPDRIRPASFIAASPSDILMAALNSAPARMATVRKYPDSGGKNASHSTPAETPAT